MAGDDASLYFEALAASERAVQAGQFNLSKTLRAVADSLRVAAMDSARDAEPEGRAVLGQIGGGPAADLARRALASLERHADVSELDVAQFLWVCSNCGAVFEGMPRESCPCGALRPEIRGFFPFFSSNSERLGRMAVAEVISNLKATPEMLRVALATVPAGALHTAPAEDEWSPGETVGHMLETERLFQRRCASLLAGERVLDGGRLIMPWLLQQGGAWNALDATALLAAHAEVRAATLQQLEDLDGAAWGRSATSGGERTTLHELGTWLANHDIGHIAQVRRHAR